jgi:hypothetical protein
VCAICCAVDVVGHERCDEDGADELEPSIKLCI